MKYVSDDFIVKNEIINDGDMIHMYYLPMYNEYVSYGYSAFIVFQTFKNEGQILKESYSIEYQMPMVRVNEQQLKVILSKGIKLSDSIGNLYYHVQSFITFDEKGYDDWAQMMRR